MIVRTDKHFVRLLQQTWPVLVYCSLAVLAGQWVRNHSPYEYKIFSPTIVGLAVTAMGIFMVFRVNEAYERWWEARKLWGGMVNSSRYFARQVISLLPDSQLKQVGNAQTIRKEMVYRHIAYVYSVSIALRFGASINPENAAQWTMISEFLDDEEFEAMQHVANIPTQLNAKQARRLNEVFGSSAEDAGSTIMITQIDNTLNDHLNIQGGCERIKNTEFPALVAYFTTSMVWMMGLLLPMASLDADGHIAPSEFVFLVLMGYTFIAINQLGSDLKRPFENKPNDTSMTALSRVIEIDLRQMLGETDTPNAIQPVNGVLM